MNSNVFFTAIGLAAAAFTPSTAVSGPIRLLRMCEASAASALDADHFAVASDDSELLRVYVTGNPQPLSESLRQPDVTDIEGSTQIGDTVFWVTSHSLNKNGRDKVERKVLFATSVSDGFHLSATGKPYRGLRADIARALEIEEAAILADFNIEGMASTPADTLLIGLRGPLASEEPSRAYVVEIANPFKLIADDAVTGTHADVVKVHKLKLFDDGEDKGRGIRSIERAGNRYIIVAGSVLDSDQPSRLYSWDGVDDGNLKMLPAVDVGGLVPEAMIAWSGNDIQLLGDNGGVVVEGTECDDKHGEPPGAWFPSARLNPDAQ